MDQVPLLCVVSHRPLMRGVQPYNVAVRNELREMEWKGEKLVQFQIRRDCSPFYRFKFVQSEYGSGGHNDRTDKWTKRQK